MPAYFPLPPEIIIEIAESIPCIADISAFARTCRQTYATAINTLYRAACNPREANYKQGCEYARRRVYGAPICGISAAEYYLMVAAHDVDTTTLARLLQVIWPVDRVSFGIFTVSHRIYSQFQRPSRSVL